MALFILLTNAFAADPAPTQLKEVAVTATLEALAEQREAVSQKTVIDRKEIEALGWPTHGMAPHQLLLDGQGNLVVADGDVLVATALGLGRWHPEAPPTLIPWPQPMALDNHWVLVGEA